MTWIGAGITTTIIPFVTGNTTSSAELYAYNKAIELGDLIIIPCAVLCGITGLLLCWQTPASLNREASLSPSWRGLMWMTQK